MLSRKLISLAFVVVVFSSLWSVALFSKSTPISPKLAEAASYPCTVAQTITLRFTNPINSGRDVALRAYSFIISGTVSDSGSQIFSPNITLNPGQTSPTFCWDVPCTVTATATVTWQTNFGPMSTSNVQANISGINRKCNYDVTTTNNIPPPSCRNGDLRDSTCNPTTTSNTTVNCVQSTTVRWNVPSGGTPNSYTVRINNGGGVNTGTATSYTFTTARSSLYNWYVQANWDWGSNGYIEGPDFTTYGNSQCAATPINPPTQSCDIGGGTPFSRNVKVAFSWNGPEQGGSTMTLLVQGSPRLNPTNVGQNTGITWEVQATYGSFMYTNGSVSFTSMDCRPPVDNDQVSFTYTCKQNGSTIANVNVSWASGRRDTYGGRTVYYQLAKADTKLGSYQLFGPWYSTTSGSTTIDTRPQENYFWKVFAFVDGRYDGDGTWLNGNVGVSTPSNYPPGGGDLTPLCDADITSSGPFDQTLARKFGGNSVNTNITINRNRGWGWPVGLWIGSNSANVRGDATRCLKAKANAVTVGNIQIWCPDLDSANNVSFPPSGVVGTTTITIFIDENAPIANTQFKVFACDYTAHADGFTLATLNSGDPAIVTNCIVSNPVLVKVPLPDLKLEFKRPDPCSENSRYTVNDNATCNFVVTNVGGSNSTSTIIGLWRIPRDRANEPATWCPTPNSPPAPPPDLDVNVPGLNPNEVTEVSHTFPVGNDPRLYTLVAYVNPLCGQQDANWLNNGPVRQNYSVDTESWFKTMEGDLGSGGTIAAPPLTPPAGEFNSDYLIVSGGGQTNVLSKKPWTIKNYRLPLDVPEQATVFDWLKEHFYSQTSNLSSKCDISSGNHEGWNICRGNATYKTSAPNGVPAIWFVVKNNGSGGNLTIENNMVGSTAIFIAEGDIVINSSVTQVDAILIAKGTIKVYGAATSQGPQLVVNGAMYGGTVDLNRNCDLTCSNQVDPTVTVNFKPKYLSVLKDWLGISATTWQEVAP